MLRMYEKYIGAVGWPELSMAFYSVCSHVLRFTFGVNVKFEIFAVVLALVLLLLNLLYAVYIESIFFSFRVSIIKKCLAPRLLQP